MNKVADSSWNELQELTARLMDEYGIPGIGPPCLLVSKNWKSTILGCFQIDQ